MTTYRRPLPDFKNPVTKPFWEGLKRDDIMLQKCDSCGYIRYPPARVCPECLDEKAKWVKLSGRGKVWSHCVYYHLFDESFKNGIPYNTALVQLEEGPMLVTNLVGVDNKDLKINMPVEAVFEDVTPEVTLLKFKPAGQRPAARRRPR